MLYFSQRDYLLKSAKVFGADVAIARKVFDENGYRDYHLSHKSQFLEFHVNKIQMLEKLNMEVGLSTNILENRDGITYLHELKVDVTTPKTFQLWDL